MEKNNRSLHWLPLDAIRPNPQQPRQEMNENKLRELADSIRVDGVLQPIEVEANGDGYILHHGERRLRAARIAGLTTIPAIVAPSLAELDRLIRAAVENIQREDMNVIEEGRAYQVLVEKGWTKFDIALRFSKAQATVANRLGWLDLDEEIRELVASGDLPRDSKVQVALKSLPDDVRVKLARKMKGQSVKAIVKAVTVYLNMSSGNKRDGQPGDKRERQPAATNKRKPRGRRVHALTFSLGDQPFPGESRTTIEEVATNVCKGCPLYEYPPSDACMECPLTQFVKAYAEKIAHG